MKQYPSIDATVRRGILVYAFDKLDGSNIRAEWDRKKVLPNLKIIPDFMRN
jgi:hypothetical protein